MGCMSETITYRTLRREDYPALTELLCDTWYLKPDTDRDLAMKLAEADLEYCLARTTTAQMAVQGETVVGVVLGRIDAAETRKGVNRHHRASMKILASLLFNKQGRAALQKLKKNEEANRNMLAEAKKEGHAYDAEVVLLLVSPSARGQGVGKHLFDWLLGQFKANGVTRYFLYTDTGCDYQFYDRAGLTRRKVLDMEPHTVQEDAEVQQEASDLDEHLHAFLYDNEVAPANEGVNPLGRD